MMNKKDFMNIIETVINDWKSTNFVSKNTQIVPGLDDKRLTYGNGAEKTGLEMNTCVLYVDIRNSVQLTKDKQVRTMGRLYSVFTHCMLLAAQEEGGLVRNIIGDRVMIVFPEENCYTKAVNCAITINHIAKLINKKIDNLEFKCGIGIDYGRINVMKVGIVKKGCENDDNKGLIWVGYPANFASRLTDCANKEFADIIYEVDAEFYETNYLGMNSYFGEHPNGWYRKIKNLTAEELANSISLRTYGAATSLTVTFRNTRRLEKKEDKYQYKPILVSKRVLEGFKKESPNDKSILENWWHEEKRKIKDVDFIVYGADIYWVV